MPTDFQKTIEAKKKEAKTSDAQEALAIQNMTDEQQAKYKAMSTTEKAAHMKELLAKSKSKLVESAYGERSATAPKVKAEPVTTTQ
tara:strand:- start:542 stop:799 length:258 start_codon:yes stop_codon:yes gene_type:complete